MLIGINGESLFCDYYSQWISVYKEGAIREVTMGKYRLTQSWLLITPILLRRSTCRCYTVPRLADTCRCGNR